MVSDLQKTTASIEELNMEIRERKQIEEKQEKLLKELQEALSKIKTLSGFPPICAYCKRIRDDKGYWSHGRVIYQQSFRSGIQSQYLPGL